LVLHSSLFMLSTGVMFSSICGTTDRREHHFQKKKERIENEDETVKGKQRVRKEKRNRREFFPPLQPPFASWYRQFEKPKDILGFQGPNQHDIHSQTDQRDAAKQKPMSCRPLLQLKFTLHPLQKKPSSKTCSQQAIIVPSHHPHDLQSQRTAVEQSSHVSSSQGIARRSCQGDRAKSPVMSPPDS
jgi:hypothetical protein